MGKNMSVKDAIAEFEKRTENKERYPDGPYKADSCLEVDLYGMYPPVAKMDATLATLKKCERLSLSTNNIDKITSLSGLDNLKILSLGRNVIKKIENLDGVADTLEELWLSYNMIDKLTGLAGCDSLKILHMGQNNIKSWEEIEKLAQCDKLEEILFIGCPIWKDNQEGNAWRLGCLKRLPKLKKIDGVPVDDDEREEAANM